MCALWYKCLCGGFVSVGAVLKKIKFLGSKDPGLKVCPLKVRGCPVMGFQGEGVTHLTF